MSEYIDINQFMQSESYAEIVDYLKNKEFKFTQDNELVESFFDYTLETQSDNKVEFNGKDTFEVTVKVNYSATSSDFSEFDFGSWFEEADIEEVQNLINSDKIPSIDFIEKREVTYEPELYINLAKENGYYIVKLDDTKHMSYTHEWPELINVSATNVDEELEPVLDEVLEYYKTEIEDTTQSIGDNGDAIKPWIKLDDDSLFEQGFLAK